MLNKNSIKDVLNLAFPAVGEMILYMMIWVFDTMMVGQYGGNIAVSTVGLCSEIMYTFTDVFISMGICIGITSLTARKFGAVEIDSAEQYATLGFAAGALISLIISITTYIFCGNILIFAGAGGKVLEFGIMFMKITSVSAFFSMLSSIMNSILRGYGNTRTPLFVSIIINIINIFLDWVLIFGRCGFPELGIKGSAIATSSAQISGFIFILIYMIKKSKIKIRIKYIKKINSFKLKSFFALSIPSSAQECAFDVSRLLSTFIIMHLGNIAFASNQIATTIESISFMPGWGFGIAATTLVGHKIGEKNYKKAKEYAYTCTFLGTMMMCLCSILFLSCPTFLINLFINSHEKEVIHLGAMCLMVASVEQPFMGISMIFGGALKGFGDTKSPFFVSLFSSWAIRLPLMFYFLYILKLSIVYVWIITAIQWFFDGTLIFMSFRHRFKVLEH